VIAKIVKNKTKRRVALFGGSFNPPHIGHTAICKWLAAKDIADEVWIIPCFIHPFGKDLAPFTHRLKMCKLAFAALDLPLRILEIERELGGESKTIRTIEHLISHHPDMAFSFVTGGDIESEIMSWHSSERIKKLVEIVKIPRGKKSPIPDVSSTEIRRLIQSGKDYKDMVESDVAEYIDAEKVYVHRA
jgi:nicotinate-nucleotide adenylyltransferase